MAAPIPTPNWVHPAQVVRVIDGDTFVALIDLGRYPSKVHVEVPVRIAGLYTPERDEEGGPDAREALGKLVMGQTLTLATRKPDPRDAYGRVVADAWVGSISVADKQIEDGFGKGTP